MQTIEVEIRGEARYRVAFSEICSRPVSVTRVVKGRVAQVVPLYSRQAKGAIGAALRQLKK